MSWSRAPTDSGVLNRFNTLTQEEFRLIQRMCDKACEHLQGCFDEDDADAWEVLEKKLERMVR